MKIDLTKLEENFVINFKTLYYEKTRKEFLNGMRIGAISLTAMAAPFSFCEMRAETLDASVEIAQQSKITVEGTVVDDLGDPVIGANVLIKGITGVGTITDMDGKFTIQVPYANATLNISFIGYTPVD